MSYLQTVAILSVWMFAAAVRAAILTGTDARELTFDEYQGESLVAAVHAERMFVDYESKGFFRIGLLPKLVVTNVQIEIQSKEALTNALAGLQSGAMPNVAGQRLELKTVEIKLLGEGNARLTASKAQVLKNTVVELTTVSFLQPDGSTLSVPKATLHLSGAAAGQLCWQVDGHAASAFIFNFPKNQQPTNTQP